MLCGIIGGYCFIALSDHWGSQHSLCLFKNCTGIPCPGCGMGRASLLLFHGRFYDAMMMHPLAFPFLLFAIVSVVWIVSDLIRRRTGFYRLISRPLPGIFVFVLLAVIAANWIWSILKGL